MANFWGAAAEGFNQGLAEAMRRAAEKRQMEYERQRTADERLWRERVAADERAYQDERDRIAYDRENPIAAFMPGPQADPFAILSNPSLLGQTMRRRDIEFQNEQELNAAKLEAMRKGLAIPEGPTGSVLVPEGRFGSGYYEDPNNPGQVWVPGSQVSNATEQRRGGGSSSPLNQLVDVPFAAIDKQYQPLFAELVDENGIVQMPRSQQLRVVITTKPQVSTDEDADRALANTPALIPEIIFNKMTDSSWGAFAARFKDAFKETGSQQEAMEAAYSAVNLGEMFPNIKREGGGIRVNTPLGIREKPVYLPSDFERFYAEFAQKNKIPKDVAKILFDKMFGITAEQPEATPQPEAKMEVPKPGEDPEDSFIQAELSKIKS